MPAPTPASVRVDGLARRYGPVEALRGVTFEVRPGEIYGLLGPNGAGKTTALECVLGLRRPDSGSVWIGGIDARAMPEAAKEIVGAQIQGATLQDKITPRRALGLFASFYRAPANVDGLIGRFGLSAKADAPFDSLSGGQRQRLFLALAFVNDPEVVLLDEPTVGLDPGSRRDLRDLIVATRGSGRAVLISTHDLEEAHQVCDRVGVLDAGRIVAEGRPDDLIARTCSFCDVEFRTARPLDRAQMESLPGVKACSLRAGACVLRTENAHETVVHLVRAASAGGNQLTELRILRPSLEDAFLALTGRDWSDGSEEVT